MRIYLIHAVMAAMGPVQQEIHRAWPEAEAFNLLDDSLEVDRTDPQSNTSERIQALAHYAIQQGASGILFTCSAFGEAVEKAASATDIPVLKPNEAMFHQAIEQGGRVAMVATFEPAIAGMEREFLEIKQRQDSDAVLAIFCVPEARQALQSGDQERHDQLVAEKISDLVGFDAIMLAHFSTSSAKNKAQGVTDSLVLTSPGAAVAMLKRQVLKNRPYDPVQLSS
ncbi:aspartate/glutamate racemase family protein [Franzmannia pantelleriensis]|nr:aspartate/glutamate racemase family protein [Halomonas pantelleriensis]